MTLAARIRGDLDVDRLFAAFDTVVAASDALRTIVVEADGRPCSKVLPAVVAPRTVVNLDSNAAYDWMQQRVSRPLDIAERCFDSVVLRHGPTDHTWLLTLHHIVTDGWSSALVFRSTAAAYSDQLESLASFSDYSTFATRDASTAAPAARFVVPDPLYGERGAATTRAVRCPVEMTLRRLHLVDDLLAKPAFRSISRDLARLAFVATTTAVWINRVAGRSEFSFGVPVHNRRTADQRSTIGLLVELFPLRFDIGEGDSFQTIYQRIIASLVALLRQARPGVSPPQDFDFVLNVITATAGTFGDLETQIEWIANGHIDSHHAVRVQLHDFNGAGATRWDIDVNEAVAHPQARQRIGAHLLAVIDAFLADPSASIGSFPLLAPEDRLDVATYNSTRTERSPSATVVEHIDQRLAASASCVLRQGNVSLDGATLHRRINAVAGALRQRGVRPGVVVGVRMPRSIDAVVAIHAVMRAGGAFVPIDPSFPASRQQHLIDQARAAFVLDDLSDLGEVDTFDVSTLEFPDPDDVAYVLFTSGTTGKPKGVAITHRGIAEYLQFAIDTYVGYRSAPTVALVSSFTFDLTMTSLILPFMTGGTLVVFPEDGLPGLRAVADDPSIDFFKCTPSHLELWVRLIEASTRPFTFVVGGEAFSAPLAARLASLLPSAAIYNEYGPTEAVVGCMIHRFDPAADHRGDVPIGRPAPNTRLYVLDQHQHVAPIGAAGELYIARAGMASGYIGQPELTAAKFVTLPAVDEATLYRTGDRVRLDSAASMTFLGRVDDQMKVNGVRLEPGEIESALREHPAVTHAVARLWSPAHRDDTARLCVRCGLSSDVPDVTFDHDGVCSTCQAFDAVRAQTTSYFRTPAELLARIEGARSRGAATYDCLHLLSGGKDSTYALYQLVELGLRPYALTLDNGFISEQAKANIRRVVEDLGIDHEFATTTAMNEIFRDSLERYSNVCNGCYKTIYTLSINRARELGIPAIVTGLSRGQLFETRLVPMQFAAGRFDPEAIDRAVLEARKIYHRTADAVNRLLDVTRFETDEIFDEVEIIDFYRYVDVQLTEMLSFLDERAPWIRPTDTGRSTNCLINQAGIFVHTSERGFHNYALPYSWDVKLGHKDRDEALEELNDPLDHREITRLLADVGYQPQSRELLTVWYSGPAELNSAELRAHLSERVAPAAVPAAFVYVPELPLTPNGKIATQLLPAPRRVHRTSAAVYVAPSSSLERDIAAIWESVLGLERVGVSESFFDLGGASLAALEMIVRIGQHFDVYVPEELAFTHRTVAELAKEIAKLAAAGASATVVPSRRPDAAADVIAPLSPSQEAMLYELRLEPDSPRYNVGHLFRIHGFEDPERVTDALRTIVGRHDVLRTTFGSPRVVLDVDQAIRVVEAQVDDADLDAWLTANMSEVFDLNSGPLVRAYTSVIDSDTVLQLVLPHIVCDASSIALVWEELAVLIEGRELSDSRYLGAGSPAVMSSDAARADKEFWLRRSSADHTDVSLPLPRPIKRRDDGYVSLQADHDVAAGPQRFACRPFVFYTAAFAAAMHRYLDLDEVPFGVVVSTRERESAQTIGLHLNTLPLTLSIRDGDSMSAVCRRAEPFLAEALAHRHYPLTSILRDRRQANRQAAVPTIMFVYESSVEPSLKGHRVSHRVVPSGVSIADLTVFVHDHGDHVELAAEYSGARFDERDVVQVLQTFERVMIGGVQNADQTIGSYVLGDIPMEGPATATANSVIDSIYDVAKRRPAAVAVSCGGVELTYGELLARAERAAATLRSRGISRGERVALVMRRSPDFFVAMLGTLISGACYVPIDSEYPSRRIADLVARSRAAVAIIDTSAAVGDAIDTVRAVVDVVDIATLENARSPRP